MGLIILGDVLEKAGVDLKKTKLIRHATSDNGFKQCYDKNMILEYTQVQAEKNFRNYDYWIVFIADKGTNAVLHSCYKVGVKKRPVNKGLMPKGFPFEALYNEQEGVMLYDLKKIDLLKDYEGRMVIEWGAGTRAWHQKATIPKEIIAIQAKQTVTFKGYENIVLSYEKLKEIVENNSLYGDWHTALSSVKGIYLIVDRTDGKQYVGSAYGSDGILQRWMCYVDTKHGNNKQMKALICDYPERYHNFQFSILQVCSTSTKDDDIIALETLYKEKLQTKMFGLNSN